VAVVSCSQISERFDERRDHGAANKIVGQRNRDARMHAPPFDHELSSHHRRFGQETSVRSGRHGDKRLYVLILNGEQRLTVRSFVGLAIGAGSIMFSVELIDGGGGGEQAFGSCDMMQAPTTAGIQIVCGDRPRSSWAMYANASALAAAVTTAIS
jgi:hypothetical protein